MVILGVNSDADRREVQTVAFRNEIPWRSWWDGGTKGPIAARYRVQGWPTIFVIDANGIVRYTNVQGLALEQAVDHLLHEMTMKN